MIIRILLICLPPIIPIKSDMFDLFYDAESIIKAQQLSVHYAKLAEIENCVFIDANLLVKISAIDGIHIEKNSLPILAKAISQKILAMKL